MDTLSSQATVGGYKAVLLAADRLPKFFPLLTTAAGTIRPARGIVMGAGVAIMQVTMPPSVRAWVPHRIGFATAVYTNGLLVGEILPVVLMFPLVLPLAGGSWQWAFVIWSVPVAIIAVIVLMLAPTSAIDRSAPQRRVPARESRAARQVSTGAPRL